MIDVLQQDYVRTLRSRGLPTRSVLLKHALRNAAPACADRARRCSSSRLLSGAVVVEKVFGLNGIGERATSAASQGDVPLVLGVVVVTVADGRPRQPAARPRVGLAQPQGAHRMSDPVTDGVPAAAPPSPHRSTRSTSPSAPGRPSAACCATRSPWSRWSGWRWSPSSPLRRPAAHLGRARPPPRSPRRWRRWAAPTRSAPTASAATCSRSCSTARRDQPRRRAHRRRGRRSLRRAARRHPGPATTAAGSTRSASWSREPPHGACRRSSSCWWCWPSSAAAPTWPCSSSAC